MTRSRPRSSSILAAWVVLGFGLAGCSSSPAPSTPSPAGKAAAPAATNTKVLSFTVSSENLNIDKVGLRDGYLKPDGSRDLAFTTSIQGPYDALFLVSTNQKGEPGYGLRADTLVGHEEIPTELGGVIDTGKMTVGIGVVEGGKFTNAEGGGAHGSDGLHNLTLYVPNTATLRAGMFVRLYVRVNGALVPGPITPY